ATPTEPAAARPSNARLRRRGARADGSMVPVDDPSVVGGDATTFALGAAGAGAAFALAGRRLTVTGDAEIGLAASAWAGAALCGARPLGSGVSWTGQAGIGGRSDGLRTVSSSCALLVIRLRATRVKISTPLGNSGSIAGSRDASACTNWRTDCGRR